MSVETRLAPRSGKRWAIGLVLAILLLAAGAAWWAFFGPPRDQDVTGLDGVWREEKNPKHLYKFRKDGKLQWKTEALVLGDLLWGDAGTWRRDGSKITVLPERNWKVEGELTDDGT